MTFTKEQYAILMKDAFKGEEIPEYNNNDVALACQQLKPEILHVLRYRLRDKLSFKEIAKIMNYSATYPSNLYNQALSHLRLAHGLGWPNKSKPICKDTPILMLGLSVRTYNILVRNRIVTIYDLVKRTREDLVKLRFSSDTIVDEIEERLKKVDLHLKGTSNKESDVLSFEKQEKEIYYVEQSPRTQIHDDLLFSLRGECMRRRHVYGYKKACIECKYKGSGEHPCMFKIPPRDWSVSTKWNTEIEINK